MGGAGLLVFFTQIGTFDALRYSFGSFFSLFKKDQSGNEKYLTYSKYKDSLAGRARVRCRFILLPALGYFLIGSILTAVYYFV